MPASSGPRRRAVITAIPVAAVLASSACTSSQKPQKPQEDDPRTLRFFTSRQAAVIEDATARLDELLGSRA